MVATLRIDGGSLADLAAGIGRWVQQATVQIATEERARAGLGSDTVVVTDGVRGKAVQEVKPFGKVVFVARPNIAEAVLWALAKLIERSPVGPAASGHYRDDHIVMINGMAVTGNLRVALAEVGPGDRIQIVNPRIYARKLEGATAKARTQRARRRGSSRQAPNGIYRVVQRLVVQRYSKSLFVDFKYVKLNTGVRVWG
ncbi:MAG: hypothetical protein KIT82_22060, partial [Bradyrhizobium sp.]|nr:hypothetical protein [Bradyrhizobium sp.]